MHQSAAKHDTDVSCVGGDAVAASAAAGGAGTPFQTNAAGELSAFLALTRQNVGEVQDTAVSWTLFGETGKNCQAASVHIATTALAPFSPTAKQKVGDGQDTPCRRICAMPGS